MTPASRPLQILAVSLAMVLGAQSAAGQATDVECDQCVDAADIASSAITSGKIADGSIDGMAIAPDAIKSSLIKDGSLVNGDLAPDAVSSGHIDNGSLTGADLKLNTITGGRIKNRTIDDDDIADGAIVQSKLAADAVFGRILFVRASPASAAANCAALLNALSGVPGNNSEPVLVKLEPGVYDCSNSASGSGVILPPKVELEGSGQGVTLLTGDADEDGEAVIQMAADSALRFLSVENISSTPGVVPHAIVAPAFARLAHVSLTATHTAGGDAEAIDCAASVASPAFEARNATVTSETATNCSVGGAFIATRIDTDSGVGAGGHVCIASFDAAYAALDSTCAP